MRKMRHKKQQIPTSVTNLNNDPHNANTEGDLCAGSSTDWRHQSALTRADNAA